MRIEVKDAAVTTRSGTGKNGKPYSFREQRAWVHLGKAYPSEVSIRLSEDQAPFSLGEYQVHDGCYWIDRWGKVNCDLAHMQPVRPVAAARTA